MKLRWRDLRESTDGVDIQETVEMPTLVKENRQLIALSPVQVNVHGRETAGLAEVEGKLFANVTYRCSRCLVDFSEELHVPFAEQFVQVEEDKLADVEASLEGDRIPVAGDTFDLTPYVEQEVALALPYAPLHAPDCKGLCPVCGVNLNETTCSCNTERIDPRLADLAKFFETDK
ncbi:DUF177 domain-containing protein [Tumebacillus sp. ITR2]|uniref:DUF177 domain-containing protein n=1 Tax=Tumebacillus amylolyticus TaxID=2801339 RepID=A0ABS1JF58_9BACL|nr:DUF177 domain-containing protein [Tumebacillus amylolyticus]MBL0388850.1 DUF177 domain-containing protein [Tumebacillus amylolyticus]